MIIGLGIMIIVWAVAASVAGALGNWQVFWYGLAALYVPAATAGGWWAVRELRRRAAARRALEQRVRDGLRQVAAEIDQALTLICDPCHGRAGQCRCTSRLLCDNPDCPAPDTGVLSPADVRWLRSIEAGDEELPR
jgi:hypothetical protein